MQIIKHEQDNCRVKKSATEYENFSSSKQSFDEVRFLQAINGNVVLRGKNGRRDKIYPLPLAAQRFSRWFQICQRWEREGFHTQCEELVLVLENLGAKIQEAVAQRLAGLPGTDAPPAFCTPKFMASLQQALKQLRFK